MLSRMLAADRHYDGAFITGVVSTGIYCLPSCRARKPKPENVVFCQTTAQAQALGLRACQRCRPDDFYAGIDAAERQLQVALRSQPASVEDWARRAGFGPSRLHELCRHYFHAAPAEVLSESRIHRAQQLLLTTERSVTDIAYEVGFESLSAFGTQFARQTRAAPTALREWAASGVLRLKLPLGYSLAGAQHELSRDPLATTSRLQGGEYQARVWAAGEAVRLAIRFEQDVAIIHTSGTASVALLHGLLRLLGLDRAAQVGAFEKLAQASKLWPHPRRRGLHLHGTFDAFDAAVWAVLGQQVTFGQAAHLRQRLLACLSEPEDGLLLLPRPETVLTLAEANWQSLRLPQQRQIALRAVAQAFAAGELPLFREDHSTPSLERRLRSIGGVGPWTAQYILLRGYGFGDIFPTGDAALRNALPTSQLSALAENMRPYRSLAALHLWQAGKFNSKETQYDQTIHPGLS